MPIFAVDSKKHHKEWYSWETGEKRTFDALIGVVVNPLVPEKFYQDYSEIMTNLFDDYGIRRSRRVYKAHDIGELLGERTDASRSFYLNFARQILSLDDVKVAYCVTRINRKHLQDGKVTIYGQYGTATQQVTVQEFIKIVQNYYNVVCAWFVAEKTGIPRGHFVLDGVDSIPRSICWDTLRQGHKVEIIFNGDRVDPLLSTADILLRSLDTFLQQYKRYLNENTVRDIVLYDDRVPAENKYFYYIGNPHIDQIKPLSDRHFSLRELQPYIRRPILFVSAGGLPGQKSLIETSPLYDQILDIAYAQRAGLRFFNPNRDRYIVGRGESADLFLALNEVAEQQYGLLRATGRKIRKIEIVKHRK